MSLEAGITAIEMLRRIMPSRLLEETGVPHGRSRYSTTPQAGPTRLSVKARPQGSGPVQDLDRRAPWRERGRGGTKP